jgi:glycosyltransferase involved in cell wall biosynthesis
MARNHALFLSTALAGGGAEAVAKLMVERLNGSTCVLFENDASVVVSGREIRVISRWRPRGSLTRLLVNIWRLLVVQTVKFQLRPKVTISHLEGPNFANILTFLGGRRILFVHNRVKQSYHRNSAFDKLKKFLVTVLYRRADRIVGVSEEVCGELINSFGVKSERTLFIPNPIDRDAIFAASTKSYGDIRDQLCDQRYLINVASLTFQKNHELLLRVFHDLINRRSDCSDLKLVLIGEGDRRQNLLSLCEELGLKVFLPGQVSLSQSNQVYFMGFEKNPYPFLKHAKLLVMTSFWEGLPIALLEAMSLGIPAVVSDCSSGIRSIWEIPQKQPSQSSEEPCRWSSCGALIDEMGSSDVSLGYWSETVYELLSNPILYERCRAAARNYADRYNISEIEKIWQRKLLDST